MTNLPARIAGSRSASPRRRGVRARSGRGDAGGGEQDAAAETVAAAYAAGLRLFGENRVEEAGPRRRRWRRCSRPAPPPAWHMVGHVQSRKAEDVLPWASMVHSVDSVKLAHG